MGETQLAAGTPNPMSLLSVKDLQGWSLCMNEVTWGTDLESGYSSSKALFFGVLKSFEHCPPDLTFHQTDMGIPNTTFSGAEGQLNHEKRYKYMTEPFLTALWENMIY